MPAYFSRRISSSRSRPSFHSPRCRSISGLTMAMRGPWSVRLSTAIGPFGTKRIEIEFMEELPVERFESLLTIPLKPEAYHLQTAARLSIHLELESAHQLRDFQVVSKAYPVQIHERTPHRVKLDFDGRLVRLSEDFAVKYSLESAGGDRLEILAQR